MTSTAHLTDPYWKRHVLFLLLSQIMSILGSSVVQYAIIWHITLATESGTALMLGIVSSFLPLVLFSPLAGTFADQHDRRVIAVLSDAIVAISTVVIMIAFLAGYESLWLMMVVLFIRGAGSTFQTPALNALLPMFVPEDQLTRVNGAFGAGVALSNVVGPILGGAILTFWSISNVFMIDIVTAALGISIFWFFVKVPSDPKRFASSQDALASQPNNQSGANSDLIAKKPSALHDLRDTLRYIRHHDFYLAFFLYSFIGLFLVGAPAFLSGLHIVREFGARPQELAILESSYCTVMLVGGALVTVWPGFKREIFTILLADLLSGIIIFALGCARDYWSFVIICSLIGIFVPYINAPSMALVQRTCPPERMGKMMSLMMMISGTAMPLGVMIFGVLGDFFPLGPIIQFNGLAIIVLNIICFAIPAIRHAGLKKNQPNAEPSDKKLSISADVVAQTNPSNHVEQTK